jgi:protein-tyrosine phosphatase
MTLIADPSPLQNPPPRLNGARNFRSLRGMPAAGGLRIASDALLRSDHLGQLTAEDWATLGAMGLQTICDLRGQEERSRAPTPLPEGAGVRVMNFDIRNDVRDNPELARSLQADPTARGTRELMLHIYRIFPEAFAPRLADWFGVFSEQRVPVLVHCAAGKDRTGFMVALLLHTLGVSRDDILRDYLLSAPVDGTADPRIPGLQAMFHGMAGLRLSPQAIMPILQVEPDYLQAALDSIDAQFGSVEHYLLKAGGVDSAQIERLRQLYLA